MYFANFHIFINKYTKSYLLMSNIGLKWLNHYGEWLNHYGEWGCVIPYKYALYRVTHKEWDFRADCTEFMLWLFSQFSAHVKLCVSLPNHGITHEITISRSENKESSHFKRFRSSLQSHPLWVTRIIFFNLALMKKFGFECKHLNWEKLRSME